LWRANPDYFPYFNELAPHPERVLVDSDLDWGQDLRRLERRLAELQVPRVSLAYQGTADLSREVLPPFVRLPPRQTATGWVAITALTREHEPLGYAWLYEYQPLERVGKTIDLYFIPEPRAESPVHRALPPGADVRCARARADVSNRIRNKRDPASASTHCRDTT